MLKQKRSYVKLNLYCMANGYQLLSKACCQYTLKTKPLELNEHLKLNQKKHNLNNINIFKRETLVSWRQTIVCCEISNFYVHHLSQCLENKNKNPG